MNSSDWDNLPGASRVIAGLSALTNGEESREGWLVALAATRLRQLGIAVPAVHTVTSPEDMLYELLARAHGDDAHTEYNALRRELTSFVDALDHVRSRP
jgi:hypothetical protein